MKIEIIDNGMMICPETDFETEYLRQYHDNKILSVFLKHGSSISDLIGLKITNKQGEQNEN